MTAKINVTIDDAAARRAFEGLIEAGRDMTPLMDEIGAYLVSSTLLRFEREEAPDGSPWEPSIRARNTGGKTLQDTGRLRASITHTAGPNFAEVGSNVVYAAIHQFGGQAGRNRSVTIPQRAYLGISEDDGAEIRNIVADYLKREARP